ncbi:MAG: two-component system cell cycle response regulator [Pseudomonadales bacterium]|jgi:two-component system cell cycle response regulator
MTSDKTIRTITIANPAISLKKGNPDTAKVYPSLIHYHGPDVGKRYILNQKVTDTRHSLSACMSIAESSISRYHSIITADSDRFTIEDTGSVNGTYINDRKIKKHILNDQDVIQMGLLILKRLANNNIDNIIHDKIYQMATINAHTQIFNKQYVLNTLDLELSISKESGQPLSVIYYDLDFFKRVNVQYGRAAGDYVLQENAKMIKQVISNDGIFGRFDGEEFVVILPNTQLEAAPKIAGIIRHRCEIQRIEIEHESNDKTLVSVDKQTISAGVADISTGMHSVSDLLKLSDRKMYISKQEGRNRITY